MIDVKQSIMIIIVAAIFTAATRFLPFLIFERGGSVPKFIEYLGRVLPPALMSFLLIFCVSGVDFTSANEVIPQLICIALALVLHATKRNTFLSIGVPTVLYMVLIQLVF